MTGANANVHPLWHGRGIYCIRGTGVIVSKDTRHEWFILCSGTTSGSTHSMIIRSMGCLERYRDTLFPCLSMRHIGNGALCWLLPVDLSTTLLTRCLPGVSMARSIERNMDE